MHLVKATALPCCALHCCAASIRLVPRISCLHLCRRPLVLDTSTPVTDILWMKWFRCPSNTTHLTKSSLIMMMMVMLVPTDDYYYSNNHPPPLKSPMRLSLTRASSGSSSGSSSSGHRLACGTWGCCKQETNGFLLSCRPGWWSGLVSRRPKLGKRVIQAPTRTTTAFSVILKVIP